MFRLLAALLLSIVSVGVCAQGVVIPGVCNLQVVGNPMLEGAAGTTIGNYRVSIRTEAENRRFYLPDTTFDLHGLVAGGDLGSVVSNTSRSKLIGMWYTFEPLDPAQTGEAAPTRPVWYFIPHTITPDSLDVRYEAEVYSYTYQGEFGTQTGGQKVPTKFGDLYLKTVDGQKKFDAYFEALDGRKAYYCLELEDGTPTNQEPEPGASVQGIWNIVPTSSPYSAASILVSRSSQLRAVMTFFDRRTDGNGQKYGLPVWGYSDLTANTSAFPYVRNNATVYVPYNGKRWNCFKPAGCQSFANTANVGALQPLRLGTRTGNDGPSLNLGGVTPSISGSPYAGATLSWSTSSLIALEPGSCAVRMDATPAGLTPGSSTTQNNCPESTPTQTAFTTCTTATGQTGCSVTVRWRITDAYPQARLVAIDDAAPNTLIHISNAGSAHSTPFYSTGTTATIPAGKTYRFQIVSGSGATAPAIARAQKITATQPTGGSITATGCTLNGTSSTCAVSLNWSTSGMTNAYVYRVGVEPAATAALVTSGTSGTHNDPRSAGRYRYELYSTQSPVPANLIATSAEVRVDAGTGPSSVSVSPADCAILAPATTCSVTVNWSSQQASPNYYLFRVLLPAGTYQLVQAVAASGSQTHALAAGRYRYELHIGNPATPATLLATSSEANVFLPVLGPPATPTPPTLPAVPAVDLVSAAVGHGGGVFRVDEGGNATFRMPLDVAPGRGGHAPKLAMLYSSGIGDGIAGWGTTIEGLGVITRCPFTVEAGDGRMGQINYDASTYSFCLNGQRLVRTGQNFGEGRTGQKYRTEIDGYDEIIVDGIQIVSDNGSGDDITQPTSFTVKRKDGLIARYGLGSARRLTRMPPVMATQNHVIEEWWLASLTDRNGNVVNYHYSGDSDAGSIRLDRIDYVGGSIDFNYMGRRPAISFGAWGSVLTQRDLLFGVTVRSVAGSELRSYVFNQEPMPSNPALQRLASVVVCQATTCLSPTVFAWHDHATTAQSNSGQGNLPNGGANFQDVRAFRYGDINGDGRADIVWVDKTRSLRISLSQPSASAGLGFSASAYQTSIECERNAPTDPDPCSSEGYQRTWTLLDYNGDGRDDLLLFQNNAWRIWTSNGTSLVQNGVELADTSTGGRGTPRVMYADFDGDGLGDLLTTRAGVGSDARIWLTQRNAAGTGFEFGPPRIVVRENADGTPVPGSLCDVGTLISHNGDRGEALDFNRDGKSDMAIRVATTSCLTNIETEAPPDWDTVEAQEPGSLIVDRASGGKAVFFASKGINAQGNFAFVAMPSLLGLSAANPEAIRFGDINGDGILDALLRRPGNVSPGLHNWDEIWTYVYGNGRGWHGPEGGQCVRSDMAGNCLPVGREGQVSLLDHDGDGRMDVWSRRFSSSSNGDLGYDVMLWNGSGFGEPTPTFFHGGDSSWMRGFADIDGDGYYDNLIMRSTEVGAAWKTKRSTSHHKPRNLLAMIGHGLGATTFIDYAPTTFSTVYKREYDARSVSWGRGSTVHDVLGPRYVVSRVRSSAPTAANPANVAEMRYRYGGFRMQGGGRGGLGFRHVVSVDVSNAQTNLTEYNQRFPLIGTPKLTQSWAAAAPADVCVDPDSGGCMTYTGWTLPSVATPTALIKDTWRWRIPGNTSYDPSLIALAPTPLQVMRTSTSHLKHDRGLFLSAGNTAFTGYDDYGNLLSSTSTDFEDQNLTTAARLISTVNVYTNDTAQWLLGRLTSTTVTTTRGNLTNTRATSFSYNPTTGQLDVERLQPNGAASEKLVKVHVYDPYGNETKTVTCSSHVSETACRDTSASTIAFRPSDPTHIQRVTGRTMTGDGIFPQSEWGLFQNGSAAVQRTISVVEARDAHGNPTQTRDRHGVIGVAGYDGFGRRQFEGRADGSWSQVERRWCEAFTGGFGSPRVACPAGATYRQKTSAAGGAAAWTYFDVLDREVLTVQSGLSVLQYNAVRKTYDALGRLSTASEPYATFNPSTSSVGLPNAASIYVTTTHYDEFGRVVRTTHANSTSGAVSETRVVPQGRSVETYLPRNKNGVDQRTVQVVNGLGEIVQVVDHLGSVLTFSHDATGNVLLATRNTHDGKFAVSSSTYDALGRRTSSSDHDEGVRNYTYNALGEVVTKTAANSCEKTFRDALGRPFARRNYSRDTCNGTVETTTDWTYDAASTGIGAVYAVVHNDYLTSYSRVHDYDAFGRNSRTTTTLGGSDYITTATYDAYGRPFQSFFEGTNIPRSGELTEYNARGHAIVLRNAFPGLTGQLYHEVLEADAAGRVTKERRYGSGNLVTERKYEESTGRTEWIRTGGGALQNLSYGYDTLGNMSWRVDASGGGYLHENFTYDNLQRFTSAYSTPASGPGLYSVTAAYDGLGNNTGHTMGTKPSLCSVDESTPGPGAISAIGTNVFCYDARGNQVRTLDPSNAPGLEKRKISYTSYDLAREIRSNNPFSANTTEFAYGPGREMILRKNYGNATPALPTQTFYAGGAEIILKPGTTNREVRRSFAGLVITQTVSSAGSVVAQNVDVLLTDVLGSTHRLTDTNGVIRSGSGEQYFTPFGVRGSAANGVPLDGNGRFNFDDSRTRQGYTGHQQIDPNGLIHMGARLYDPVLARFIQADTIVPEPTDLQSLNRYSYVSNNPLAYTDPTGHWGAQQQGYLRTAVAIAISVYTAGAVSAGSFMGITVTSTNAGVIVMAGGFAAGAVQTGTLRGATTGAFSAAISFGIGNAFHAQEITAAQRAVAHAAAGGFTEAINGGNFGHGFVSAGISVAFEPMIDTGSKAADATLHAMLGGTASELSGGKFANGALTALMSYAFNQLSHMNGMPGLTQAQVEGYSNCLPNCPMAPMPITPEMYAQAYLSVMPGGGLVLCAYYGCGKGGWAMAAVSVIPIRGLSAVGPLRQGFIYRQGSRTASNLTPRPVDTKGLSASNSLENARPGTNQVIDVSKLEKLCAVCDNATTGHVSIRPRDMSQMQGWINSRGTDTVHPLTQELEAAVVGTVKK